MRVDRAPRTGRRIELPTDAQQLVGGLSGPARNISRNLGPCGAPSGARLGRPGARKGSVYTAGRNLCNTSRTIQRALHVDCAKTTKH
eukprot:8097460-Pyramimonas_sp.AAC.1